MQAKKFSRFMSLSISLCVALMAHAQLSDMKVESMELIGKVDDAPLYPKTNDTAALIVLEIPGYPDKSYNKIKIAPALQSYHIARMEDSDKYDAYAAADDKHNSADQIILHHPNFNNCTVVFADYMDKETLRDGKFLYKGHAYKIKLRLPTFDFIDAQKAFSEMKFKEAARLYRKLVSNPEINNDEMDIIIKNQETIDSLISYVEKAEASEQKAGEFERKGGEFEQKARESEQNAKEFEQNARESYQKRDRALLRSRIFYDRIFKEKGLVSAAMKIEEINNKLGIKRDRLNIPPLDRIWVSSAEIDSYDQRGQNNEAVKYMDKKKEKSCAMLVVSGPIPDMEILPPDGDEQRLYRQKHEDENFFIYVKTEVPENTDPVLFKINHPDYVPFEFKFSDLGVDNLNPEEAYNIKLQISSRTMQLANKEMASLRFEEARALYDNNFSDAKEVEYAKKCLEFLDSPYMAGIIPQVDSNAKEFRKLEREYLSIIRGGGEFANDDEKAARFAEVNKKMESVASTLAAVYPEIYSEAKRYDLDLGYAKTRANDFKYICEGKRRIPLVFDFKEVEKVEDGIYMAPTAVTSSPTVTVEFLDEKNKVIDSTQKEVTDGMISYTPSTAASSLFSQGKGKIKISTEKDLNGGKQPYKDMELEISKFKVSDYKPKRLSVSLIKK